MARAYFNEMDPFAAQWLRNLIAAGLLAPGDVDERSIKEVQPDDLRGYVQCHFFAGIGGWSYAARLAGWPDDRELWTGSCPCQPFSVAGEGKGVDDPRHLWPDFFRLIRVRRPAVVMGEQVAGKAGYGWLDGVLADLAGEDYAGRGVDIPACAVDAPHIRQRIYWAAVASGVGLAHAGCEPRRAGPGHPQDGRVGADRDGAGAMGVPERGGFDGQGVHAHERESVSLPSGADGPGEASRGGGVAHTRVGGFGRWTIEPGRDIADGDETGWEEGPSGFAGGDADLGDAHPTGLEVRGCQRSDAGAERPAAERAAGGVLVDPSGVGRGEGRAEHELRGGRGAPAGADAQGPLADADQPGSATHGRDPGEVRGLPQTERGPEHHAPVPGGEHGAPVDDVSRAGFWSDHDWLICHDGKARRTERRIPLLVDGVRGRVAVGRALGIPEEGLSPEDAARTFNRIGAWKGLGNAIVPQLAAEVIGALLDAEADDAAFEDFFS